MHFTLYFSSFHPFILWSVQAPVKSYHGNSHFLQSDSSSNAQQRLHISLKPITKQNFIVQHIFKNKYLIILAWLSCQRQISAAHLVFQSGSDLYLHDAGCTVNLENLPIGGFIYRLIVKIVILLGRGAIWCLTWWYPWRKVLTGADGPVFSGSVEFLSSV